MIKNSKKRINFVVSIEPDHKNWFKEHHMNVSSFVRGKMNDYIKWHESKNNRKDKL